MNATGNFVMSRQFCVTSKIDLEDTVKIFTGRWGVQSMNGAPFIRLI